MNCPPSSAGASGPDGLDNRPLPGFRRAVTGSGRSAPRQPVGIARGSPVRRLILPGRTLLRHHFLPRLTTDLYCRKNGWISRPVNVTAFSVQIPPAPGENRSPGGKVRHLAEARMRGIQSEAGLAVATKRGDMVAFPKSNRENAENTGQPTCVKRPTSRAASIPPKPMQA
jgi:hypothetical protein